MQLRILIVSVIFITSCMSLHRKVQEQPDQPNGPPEYNGAIAKLSNGHYAEARESLQNFLQKKPVSEFTQVANFNIAYTFEMERNFKEAAEQYREVVASTANSAPKLQAYSLYRLSYCLEAQGDDAQVIAVLTDLQSRSPLLDPEVANAEIPARLAAAYSRAGNTDLAQKYYSQAETSMIKYRRQADPSRNPIWIAKTLYHMGRVNLQDVTWQNFEVVTRPFSRAQEYLLEAAEINDPKWSKKAAEDLSAVYKSLWSIINTPPQEKERDEVLKQRAQQQRQWEMTFQLSDLIDDLKRHRLADNKSPYVESIFVETETISKEIRKLLNQKRVGTELTPAARKRILGQRPLSKLPAKIKSNPTPQLTPPPAATPESDPNL